jgi:hypothetical protein
MEATMSATTGTWQWTEKANRSVKVTIPALLWTLHDLGGEISDSRGRTGRKLAEMAISRGYTISPTHRPGETGLAQLLSELDSGGRYGGCIEREMNSRKTYKIRLLLDAGQLPPRPPVRNPAAGGTGPRPVEDPQPTPAPEPEPEPVPDEPEAVEPTLVPLALADADPVDLLLKINKMSMDAALAIAATIGQSRDQDDVARRLADTLEENNRLRRKVNDQAETISAKVKEINALRQALNLAQSNLAAIQQSANEAGQRERNLARLNSNQRFISAKPEASIARRQA